MSLGCPLPIAGGSQAHTAHGRCALGAVPAELSVCLSNIYAYTQLAIRGTHASSRITHGRMGHWRLVGWLAICLYILYTYVYRVRVSIYVYVYASGVVEWVRPEVDGIQALLTVQYSYFIVIQGFRKGRERQLTVGLDLRPPPRTSPYVLDQIH